MICYLVKSLTMHAHSVMRRLKFLGFVLCVGVLLHSLSNLQTSSVLRLKPLPGQAMEKRGTRHAAIVEQEIQPPRVQIGNVSVLPSSHQIAAQASSSNTRDYLSIIEEFVQVMGSGVNIKVGKRTEVHVMDAIRRVDYPKKHSFNIVLVTWTADRRYDRGKFVCCLSNSPKFSTVVEIHAARIFQDPTFRKIDMRYVLFACSQKNTLLPMSPADIRYVAFAENSCKVKMTETAREIVQPERRPNKVALCKTFAFGYLAPDRLVEWFEFARVVGISVVQIFYHILNEEAMKVLRYYQRQGFVILDPVTLAHRKGQSPRNFEDLSRQQTIMDKRVLMNDCLHRLSGYDYVVHMDFDELLMPSPPFNTLLEVFQNASATHRMAGAFYADSYLNILEWPDTNSNAAISFLRRLDRTVSDSIDNTGGHKSSPKIIYRPERVIGVETHLVSAFKRGYTSHNLPRNSYNFRHYRKCKREIWKTCEHEKVLDADILNFRPQWLEAISKLPLFEFGCSEEYIRNITREFAETKGSKN